MIQPKVAVLLSSYNGEKYIEEFLDSLIKQSYVDFTLFVRDDCSLDNTLVLVEQYKKYLNINLIRSKENLGSAKSFFFLLDFAGNGFDYYAFADQDDVWLPGKIERAITILDARSHEERLLYCSGLEYVDKTLTHLKWYNVPKKIGFGNALVENIATGCTIVINNSARELVLSRLPQNCLMHDWWLYLVMSCFGNIYWDDYSGIKYRQHDSNTVGAATSFFNDMQRRIRRFLKNDKSGLFTLSSQAAIFLDLFEADIPSEKLDILRSIIKGKLSLFERVKLAFSTKIWRQRTFDNILMRLMILIDRY